VVVDAVDVVLVSGLRGDVVSVLVFGRGVEGWDSMVVVVSEGVSLVSSMFLFSFGKSARDCCRDCVANTSTWVTTPCDGRRSESGTL
jgi:hypothetical protein